ncbi:Alpha/Beta hydrolase protein [Mycena crocata]|nr:Alpha/Beta hydrolase protein [Mycena crocata]
MSSPILRGSLEVSNGVLHTSLNTGRRNKHETSQTIPFLLLAMVLYSISPKLIVLGVAISSFSTQALGSDFSWKQLAATNELKWKSCYNGFQCTRLNVPLDYSSSKAGNGTIAIARYPAKITSKSKYRGPILLNPGGPGVSGVDYVVSAGAAIATILGEEFDIVGFDPRGVSYSTPMVSFFKTDAERALWTPAATVMMYPSLNESADAVAQQTARAQIQGQLAAARNGNFKYITTDNTARDMLRITEAFGWEKLQYWGVSYGSVLGSTFAAMFPDKVGRVVVDGVIDMEAWYSANLTAEVMDTDKAVAAFVDGCVAAGPKNCAFYAPSSAEINAKLDTLYATVKSQPVPVITNTSYGLVGYTFLRNVIFAALYSPYDLFAPLAQNLAALADGNAEPLYRSMEVAPFECDCDKKLPFNNDNSYEAAVTIGCGDGTPETDSVEELQAFYARQAKLSSFADMWGNWRVVCSPLQGPFGATNVSHPLLVIGNTADHVTPIYGAKKTADAFSGSVLLTLDTVGHTSNGGPSSCVHNYLRQYFRNGTLPAPGTVCKPDGVLFPSNNSTANATVGRELDSRAELLNAGRTIGEALRRVAGRKTHTLL